MSSLNLQTDVTDVYLPSQDRSLRVLNNNVCFAGAQFSIYIVCTSNLASGLNVAVGIDFYETLTVENLNTFRVSLELIPVCSNSGYVIKANKDIVVLEPLSKETSITIQFRSENLSSLKLSMHYIINRIHKFELQVTAEVVRKALYLNPTKIEFKKSAYDEVFPQNFQSVEICNLLKAPTNFFWKNLPFSLYKIVPESGTVPPNGVISCSVIFTPKVKHSLTSVVQFCIDNADEGYTELHCEAKLEKAKAYFTTPHMNVKDIPLKLKTTVTTLLFNACYNDITFAILTPNPFSGVVVTSPSDGSIRARTFCPINLTFTIQSIVSFNFTVYLELQGTAAIELCVSGRVVFPNVIIHPESFLLNHVSCNSFDTFSMFAENQSGTVACLEFQMDDFPQFKVSPSSNALLPGFGSEGLLLEANQPRKQFYLHFNPKSSASYEFLLPVTVNKFLGPPSMLYEETQYIKYYIKDEESLKNLEISSGRLPWCVNIDCTISPAHLFFNTLHFHFEICQKASDKIDLIETKDFVVSNASRGKTEFGIRTDGFGADNHFSITVKSGLTSVDVISTGLLVTLQPGESVTFKIQFQPLHHGSYYVEAPIFVRNYGYGKPFNYLKLSGIYSPPLLCCDTDKVMFTPVPLEVEQECVIRLYLTTRYQSRKVQTRIEDQNRQYTLGITFFKSNEIPVANSLSIAAVKMSFRSSIPITIDTKVTFFDDLGGKCMVQIYATADDSSITTHLYNHYLLEYGVPPRGCFRIENKNILQVVSKRLSKFSLADSTGHPEILANKAFKKPKKNSTESLHRLNDVHEVTYPLFPSESARTVYSVYMNSILAAAEHWIFEEVFHCSYQMELSIPLAFSNLSKYAAKVSKVPDNKANPKTLLDILEKICGSEVLKRFTLIINSSAEDSERVSMIHMIYEQVLEFLRSKGAFLLHVNPKYLLHYDDYVLYTKMQSRAQNPDSLIPNSQVGAGRIFGKCEFECRALQCWVDVILQTYKSLVLLKLRSTERFQSQMFKVDNAGMPMRKPDCSNQSIDGSVHDQTILRGFNTNIYGQTECFLLSWLNQVYDMFRSTVWLNKEAPPRNIKNFTRDLRDGVVLTVITAAYCPYLTPIYFSGTYIINNCTTEQSHHNALVLIKAWYQIRLGFSITASNFTEPNPVLMLMLVVYLYRILPSFESAATIDFSCPLTQTKTRKIEIYNESHTTVGYIVQIIGQTNSFSIDENKQQIMKINESQKLKLSITYFAKKAIKSTGTVVLSGACIASNFARNIVFSLEGEANKLKMSEFTIQAPLNCPMQFKIPVISPYTRTTAEYNILFTETEPTCGHLGGEAWRGLCMRKVPRRVFLGKSELTFSERNRYEAKLPVTVGCITHNVSEFWLIFSHEENGDFINKVIVKPQIIQSILSLQALVGVKKNFCQCIPSTIGMASCPRRTSVQIPCRNAQLWYTVKTMFQLTLDTAEQHFWANNFESEIGLHLVQWMLGGQKDSVSEEIDHIFTSSVTYYISCESSDVKTNPTVTIPDVRNMSETIAVPLHISVEAPADFTTTLTLTSESMKEIRVYSVHIYEKDCGGDLDNVEPL